MAATSGASDIETSTAAVSGAGAHTDGAHASHGKRASSRAADAEFARNRVLEAARVQFRERGYDRTSLEDIGAAAGLTRGAVLYHFGSKANLVRVLLQPFTQGLDDMLTELERADTPPEAVLGAVLGLLVDNRLATDLLARDISVPGALGLDNWVNGRAERLMRLLAPEGPTDVIGQIRGYAALGAMVRPIAHLPAGPLGSIERHTIQAAALGALLAGREPTTPQRSS